MDDMLIFSPDRNIHQLRTIRVLERLQEHDLYLKKEKCIFDTDRVEFLGVIIEPDRIRMDPVKVEGLKNWPTPRNLKEVRSFLGFGNFYRRLFKDMQTLHAH